MRRKLLLLGLAAMTGSWSQPAVGQTISINFNNGGATLLDPTDEVGFVPATNWNNFRNNGGLGLFNPDPTPLVDSTGNESSATIAWEVGASYFNSNNGVGNQRMMEGWFGLNEGDFGYITIEDLPASFTTATYDAYIYFDSDRTAPNERTMTFHVGDTSLTGVEFPANFQGTFHEAIDGGVGNYVVFRDLSSSTFELTADSSEGRAAITGIQLTTLPEPDPTPLPDPNDPIHAYIASDNANSDDRWQDLYGASHWNFNGAELVDVSSEHTSITSAYRLIDPVQGFGGDTSPFEPGNMTYELWVRPGDVDADHQVIFETGGGQNGTSISITDSTIRLLNSTGDERMFDMEVSLDGVDTTDFMQIVAALNSEEDEITLTVNGAAGGSVSTSETGPVGRGGNRASLFSWGSGIQNLGNPLDEGGGTFNLGGRTELPDMTPEGLREFAGEIAVMNVYARAFTAAEVTSAFEAMLGQSLLGDYNRDGILDVADLNLQAEAIASGDLAFDENGDGTVSVSDRTLWVNEYAGTWMGDSNLDGEFNSADFVAVFTAGKFEQDVEATWDEGDWNGDQRFTSSDFVAAFSNGGYEAGPFNPQAVAVPEPTLSWTLLCASGLLSLALRRSR
ncbi:MAG: hypothetical protein KDA87_00450 [Planctomycetales bacterium]|nr:hypothetical protein [Planctomycetales bacterium]